MTLTIKVEDGSNLIFACTNTIAFYHHAKIRFGLSFELDNRRKMTLTTTTRIVSLYRHYVICRNHFYFVKKSKKIKKTNFWQYLLDRF